MNCKLCQAALPDLLFEAPAPSSGAAYARLAAARAHIATCTACAAELAAFESTFSLLDAWKAPEVSPYFDQKLAVRLREEQAAPAAGWFERLRARLLFNTGRQFRPILASAMALLLIAGGGGIGIVNFTHPHPQVPLSATVNDLQLLDKNVQAEQQVDQILEDNAAGPDNGAATPPQS
jgi:anti-sigma factor RsiW